MLKIWGRANSVNVKKALWALEELGLPYERVDAGMQFGVVNSPEYRALNPNGLIPTIEDDGYVLWESHAVVRYLGAKYGAGTLWPSAPEARGEADRWMDWAHGLWGAVRPVFWGLVRTPPEKRDAASIADGQKRSAELLRVADAHLAKRAFVAGEALTMGDIPLGCIAWLWFNVPIERPSMPALEAWFARLKERPAFRKIVDIPLT